MLFQDLPHTLCLTIGLFLVPSRGDAELCCNTNVARKSEDRESCGESYENEDEDNEDNKLSLLALDRVVDVIDTIHELLNTCRWADILFPKMLAEAEFSKMWARCGCSRLLAAAPLPVSRSYMSLQRPPPLRCGEGAELHLAVVSRNARAVRVAAGRCLDLNLPDSLGETALFKACVDRFDAGVRMLLELRASPDAASGDAAYNPRTALLVACAWRDVDIVDLLLKHRADPNGTCSTISEATTPLAAVSMRPSALSMARNMVPGMYSYFERESSPRDIARLLLAAMANVEGCSYHQGRTPAWLAARDKKTAVLDVLLQHGASSNAVDHYGDSALHIAHWTGHQEGVLLLLDAQADPNVTDRDGRIPEEVQDGFRSAWWWQHDF